MHYHSASNDNIKIAYNSITLTDLWTRGTDFLGSIE